VKPGYTTHLPLHFSKRFPEKVSIPTQLFEHTQMCQAVINTEKKEETAIITDILADCYMI